MKSSHEMLVGYLALAAAAVIGASMLFGVIQDHWADIEGVPAAKPLPTHVAPVHPAPTAPAHPATVAHATTTAPAPVAAALGPVEVELPAQPAPAGLRQGFALRAIATSPAPAAYGDQPIWTPLAATTEPAQTGSWSTAIPAALRAIGPSAGLVQTQLTAYVRIATAGPHVLILSVSGGPAKAALTVDGQAAPLAQITRTCSAFTGCPQNPSTAAGSVNLAVGVHVVTVTAQTAAGDPPATMDVYVRGPGAAMPVAIAPWAVPAGAAKGVTP